jgi:rubrerythrin
MNKARFGRMLNSALADERSARRMYWRMAAMSNTRLLRLIMRRLARDEGEHARELRVIRRMLCR